MTRPIAPWHRRPPTTAGPAIRSNFPPIDRFRTLQQEISNLQARIDGLNTTLGVFVATGAAFGIYAISQKQNWKSYQDGTMWVVAAALIILLLGLVGTRSMNEWLSLANFFSALDTDSHALDNAIADGITSFETGRNSERQKMNFLGIGTALLVAGVVLYIVLGYKALDTFLHGTTVVAAPFALLFLIGQLVRLWTWLVARGKIEAV